MLTNGFGQQEQQTNTEQMPTLADLHKPKIY